MNRSQRHHHVWYAAKALDDAYRNYRGDLDDLARAAEDSTAIRGATMTTPVIRRRLAGV